MKLIPTKSYHAPNLWDIIKTYDYFSDEAEVDNIFEFTSWLHSMKDSITIFKDKEIVGCGYIDNIHDDMASLNFFIKRKTLKPHETVSILKRGMKVYFLKHNLKMVYGIVRESNRACLRLLKVLGLTVTNKLPKYRQVNGIWHDYIMASVLRENVIGENVI